MVGKQSILKSLSEFQELMSKAFEDYSKGNKVLNLLLGTKIIICITTKEH